MPEELDQQQAKQRADIANALYNAPTAGERIRAAQANLASKLQNMAGQAAIGRQLTPADINTVKVPSAGAILDAKIAACELHLEKLRSARTMLDLTPGSEMLIEHLVNADVIYIR